MCVLQFTTELRYKEQYKYALAIQRVYRGHRGRSIARALREHYDEIQRRKDARAARVARHRAMNATQIQCLWRGALCRMRHGNVRKMSARAKQIQRWCVPVQHPTCGLRVRDDVLLLGCRYRHRTSVGRTLMILLQKAGKRKAANDIQRCYRGMLGRRRGKVREELVLARRRRAKQRDPEFRARYALMVRAAAPIVQRWWKHIYKWRHTKFRGHTYVAVSKSGRGNVLAVAS